MIKISNERMNELLEKKATLGKYINQMNIDLSNKEEITTQEILDVVNCYLPQALKLYEELSTLDYYAELNWRMSVVYESDLEKIQDKIKELKSSISCPDEL